MGLGGPEDVVDGSGSKHLPHCLIDDLLIVATANCHWTQEAHNKYLLQKWVCGKHAVLTHTQRFQHHKNSRTDTKETQYTHLEEKKNKGTGRSIQWGYARAHHYVAFIKGKLLPSLSVEQSSSVSPNGFVRLSGREHKHTSKKKQLHSCSKQLWHTQLPEHHTIPTIMQTLKKIASSLTYMHPHKLPASTHLPPALFWSRNSEAGSTMSNWMGVPGAIRSSGSGAAPVFWESPLAACTPPGFALQGWQR